MKSTKSQMKLASSAIVAATFAIGSVAHAADNPFAMQKLDAGYQLAQADKMADGKCGGSKAKEGACGGDKMATGEKKKDGKCGGSKGKEGACGGDKKVADDKKKDGKCGEGKCGATKK